MSRSEKFMSNVVKNLPEVSPEMENYWNSHPSEFQEFLAGLAGQSWRVVEGVVHFTVTSDGTTGPDWIRRLERSRHRLSDYAKDALLSPDFKSTNGVTTKIAVLPGKWFFKEEDRATASRIRDGARQRWKLVSPLADTACLIREKFSDRDLEAMGFAYIAVFHKPIRVYGCHVSGHPNLLASSRQGYGHWLDAFCGKPDSRWDRHGAFAFAEK
ncbi:MAG: hypothetical protein Q8Q48_00060 [Candidatus Staskawiczbacteria bacterium]|nr:hypothetical protein [Candidatus Staskawiczbacteria bacterium]